MKQEDFLKRGFVNLLITITEIKPDYIYQGILNFPKINLSLHLRINSIIPLSKILQKRGLPRKEILPYLVEITVKKNGEEIILTKETFNFFFHFILVYVIDASLKIKEKTLVQSALNTKVVKTLLGKAIPTVFVTTETYILLMRRQDIPSSLRQKVLI